MGSIQLIRHGQASFGAADYDVLSDRGRQQSSALGLAWQLAEHNAVSYVSGGLRRQVDTAITARHAADGSVDVRIDARWDELGHLASLPTDDKGVPDTREFQVALNDALARWMVGELDAQESYRAFSARVRTAFAELVSGTGKGQVTRVFTSAGPIALVASELLAGDDGLFQRLNDVLVNAGVTTVIVGASGPRLLSLNEQFHLQPDLVTYR